MLACFELPRTSALRRCTTRDSDTAVFCTARRPLQPVERAKVQTLASHSRVCRHRLDVLMGSANSSTQRANAPAGRRGCSAIVRFDGVRRWPVNAKSLGNLRTAATTGGTSAHASDAGCCCACDRTQRYRRNCTECRYFIRDLQPALSYATDTYLVLGFERGNGASLSGCRHSSGRHRGASSRPSSSRRRQSL